MYINLIKELKNLKNTPKNTIEFFQKLPYAIVVRLEELLNMDCIDDEQVTKTTITRLQSGSSKISPTLLKKLSLISETKPSDLKNIISIGHFTLDEMDDIIFFETEHLEMFH